MNIHKIFKTGSYKNGAESSLENSTEPQTAKPRLKKSISFWPKKKSRRILLILLLIVALFLGMIGVLATHTLSVSREMITVGNELKWNAQSAYDNFKAQNLPEAEINIVKAKENLDKLNQSYNKLGIYQKIPVFNKYYQDGIYGLAAANHGLEAAVVSVKAITPYADILGFEGEGTFAGGTTEDRIGVMLQTLEKITPELDQIEEQLTLVNDNLSKIDASRYPEKVKDVEIRNLLLTSQESVDQAISIFSQFRPVIEQLPRIAGSQGEKMKYLVLFQNNNELRPTGGFLTAYSIVTIENGKITPEKSDDIYELDQKFSGRIEIPESLGRYLTTEKYWHLRDMNISPDFKESMTTFYEHYQTVRGEPNDINGIISVDTQVLTRLLEILGPVEIPGYGTFSAQIDSRCDCPQVVYALSEIITRPTPYLREDRKGILGPMMKSILQKTYDAPKQHWPQLFGLIWETVQGRNLQMYFIDEQTQLAAENANAAGRLIHPANSDFLAIVDANLGGAKSNLFTEYEVQHQVEGPTDGYITNNLEITYKNTRKADNCNLEAGLLCLNAPAPTWNRLYLPAGSEIVNTQGFNQDPNLYEELGFQVIDGFFRLDPLGVAKIRVSYKVPYSEENYQLKVWKQGGVKPFKMLVDVNGNQSELLINSDQTFQDRF